MRALRAALAGLLLALFLAPAALAAAALPELTGRVVDGAGILDAATKSALDGKLTTLEDKSSIQLVVATVKGLGGREIEPYANELFRAWKLGEAKANNGALLLIAPNEHRMRIEVGYGLEGTLTDAVSKIIIANAITPRFKAGDFNGGVTRGVDDIITALTADAGQWKPKPEDQGTTTDLVIGLAFIAAVFGILGLLVFLLIRAARNHHWPVVVSSSGPGAVSRPSTSSSSSGGFWSGGGSSGGSSGGFSGGGGSSGGGGASGSW